MENSPVMRTLRVVADMIIPLYLTDPALAGVPARELRHLHDITRFCHEKGVHEMFGGQSPLPTGAARRLVTDVPTSTGCWTWAVGWSRAGAERCPSTRCALGPCWPCGAA